MTTVINDASTLINNIVHHSICRITRYILTTMRTIIKLIYLSISVSQKIRTDIAYMLPIIFIIITWTSI